MSRTLPRSTFQRSTLATALALSLGTAPGHAQMLEEVIVTATKRAVGMQDVPIALAVMEGEKMSEQGVRSLTDVAIFMPNVHIAEASAGDSLFIRGIGSGVNYGFEQSVGTFVDGVYFGRGQASRSAFLDLERVEVLKGSQSTLFGKNTIAGAINITTARPTEEFEASVEATLEPEFDGWSSTITLSGPLADNFGARFVYKKEETDGWMDNTFLGTEEVTRDDSIGRLTLAWQPTDTLDLTLKWETGETDTVGSNELISIATPLATSIYRGVDPNFTASGLDYDKSDATFSRVDDFRRGETFHDSEWEIGTLTAELALGEYTIKSITGYVDYSFENYRDSDYSAIAALARGRDESHEQFTQEFLLTSPVGETFEFLAGVYYQDEELGHERFTDVSLSALFNAGATLPPVVASGIADGTGVNTFDQDAETWSAFFEGTYHFSDSLRLIAGIRYSEDTKEFSKTASVDYLFNVVPAAQAGDPQAGRDRLGAIYDTLLNLATPHTFIDGVAVVCPGTPALALNCTTSAIPTEREEDHITGDITIQYDWDDDTMIYAKWGNGYKAGGFDEDNGRGNIPAQEYEDEESETFEIGAKMDVWDNRGRFNIAAFTSQYDNVQVSTFDGVAGFVVGNAAESEVQGIEIDGMVALTDELTLNMAFAWLDAEYKSFPDAGCTSIQTAIFAAGPDGIAGTGDDLTPGNCTQDLSGQALQFAAEYSGNLGLTYSRQLNNDLELKAGIDVMFTDDYDTAADGDSNLAQDAFTKVNARIGLMDYDGRWSVALLGKNLTDETTTTWGNDIPLGNFGFADSYFQIIDAPRSYELQVKVSF